jgi:hypothetical protein
MQFLIAFGERAGEECDPLARLVDRGGVRAGDRRPLP